MASKKRSDDGRVSQVSSFTGGQVGASEAVRAAASTDVFKTGMDVLKRIWEKLHSVGTEQKQGNLFEYIEAAYFNADSTYKGSLLKALLTAEDGRPTAPMDIEIRRGASVLREAQLKSGKDAVRLARAISSPKYRGMQKVVPADKAQEVGEISIRRADSSKSDLRAEYRDTSENLADRLHHGEVEGEAVTYHDNLEAALDAPRFALQRELRFLAREAHETGKYSAITAALVRSVISTVTNAFDVAAGDKTEEEAIGQIVRDSAKSAAQGYAVGVTGSGVRFLGTKAGIPALAKSNIALAVGASLVETGLTVYRWVKGEIDAAEALESLSTTAITTVSGIGTGATAGLLVGGPWGALFGSIVGFFVSSHLCQVSLSITRDARLKAEEAERASMLHAAAQEQLRERRYEFQTILRERLGERAQAFNSMIADIEKGLDDDRPEASVEAIANLAATLGFVFEFETFEDFDRFMTDSDEPLSF